VITRRSTYSGFAERHGRSGPMLVVTVDGEFTNQDGELLMRVTTNVIMR
jgi:hypothetical protein